MRLLTIVFSVCVVTAFAQERTDRIGWQFVLKSDLTRSYSPAEGDLGSPPGRPIAITTWYPSVEGGTATTLLELARLGAYQRYGNPPPGAFDEVISQALNDTSATSLGAAARARRDAPPRSGKYPLILFAHSTPLGQSTMAEHLAEQGFVVAGLMSRGATAGAYRLSIDDIKAMSADMEFALEWLGSLPYVDATRVGVIGMSNGSLGAVGLANRTRVRAIVSLDGTVGEQAAARVLPALANATVPASNPPLLHLYTTGNTFLNFSELQKRTSQCVTIVVPDVRHADFLSYALLKAPVSGDQPARVRVADKFAAIQGLTLQFLSQLVLRSESTARLDLSGSEVALGLAISPCSAGA